MKSKIKWVKNSRVKKNSRIPNSDIIEKESDAKDDEVAVSMVNITKEHPIINVRFPHKPERKENKIQNSAGEWITKSWLDCPNLVASINTEENYIHFNRTRFKLSELNDLIKVINEVKEVLEMSFRITTSGCSSIEEWR